MPQPLHTVEAVGSLDQLAQQDRLMVGLKKSVINAAGGGAGTAVTTAVAFAEPLPANYEVFVSPNQDATWYVTSKTSLGFNVVLTPRLAATTLAAGTFDVLVVA